MAMKCALALSGPATGYSVVYHIEIALLFAGAARTSLFDGAPLTLTSRDAATAARLLGARWVVPLHVRGWAHFTEGPEDVRLAFERAGLAAHLRLMEPGERTAFR